MSTVFHERLQKLKEDSGRTQVEIANALDITPQALSYYFNGREPGYDLLIKIARYFNISTDFLLGLNDFDSYDMKASENEIIINLEPYKKDTIFLRFLPEIAKLPSFTDLLKVLCDYIYTPDKKLPHRLDRNFYFYCKTETGDYDTSAELSIKSDRLREYTLLPFITEILNDMKYEYDRKITIDSSNKEKKESE